MKWLKPSNYHAAMLFVIMGLFASAFAWNSYNLLHLAMQNIGFLNRAGYLAVMEGGLLQLGEIIIKGALSLAFYLGFKVCEVELVARWRNQIARGTRV